MPEAWLDVSTTQCPKCGKFYADASWYIAEIGSDAECSICRQAFNLKNNLADRVLLRFDLDRKGRVRSIRLSKHLIS